MLEASEMAHGVKTPSTKSDDLSSGPRTHKVERENHTGKLTSDLHPFPLAGTRVTKPVLRNLVKLTRLRVSHCTVYCSCL